MPPEAAAAAWSFRSRSSALFVSYFAFVPAVVADLLAEFLGERDWLFHAARGGVVGAGLDRLLMRSHRPTARPPIGGSLGRSGRSSAAGLVGGIAYWAVTGRFAGAGGRAATSPAQ